MSESSMPAAGKTIVPLFIGPATEDGETFSVQSLLADHDQKYRLIRVLAEGGVGVLYEVEDLNCRRTVAMKVLLNEQHKTPEEWTAFIEEAQITARLEHPNIIPVYDVGLDGSNRVYYTMKLVRGKTLTDILIGLRRQEPAIIQEYPLARLLNIFQKICDAVAFAHARHVLHCDLKPDNIMIADYGEVLVVDWGLARWIPPAESPVDSRQGTDTPASDDPFLREAGHPWYRNEYESGLKTLSGHIVGTPGFMAPERMDQNQLLPTIATDIYSLGAILYSLLTLRPPLKISSFKSQCEMIEAIRQNNICPPSEFNPAADAPAAGDPVAVSYGHCPDGRIPEALSRVAMRALSKDSAKRYRAVPELQQEIEAYQHGTFWQLIADHDMANPASLEHWEVIGCQAEIVEGALRLCGGKPQVLLFRQDVSGDVRIEYECHIPGGNLNNLGCFISAIHRGGKHVIPFTGYEFSYGAFDNSMISLSRADHIIWSRPASPLRCKVPFHIVAERSGNVLSLTVNDCCVFSEKDADPLAGAERAAIGLYSWLTDVRYKRVRVYARGAPWHADILDIAERQLQKGRYDVAKAIYTDILDSHPVEKRRLRAAEGLEKAYRREQRDLEVKKWQHMLEQAWPNASPKLSLVNDGLSVEVTDADITDLSPLAGLPLTTLYCQNNKIQSLEPLRGMKLELLNCSDNPIISVEPLRAMPLKSLYCENCRLRDLSPLQGMPLAVLNCGGCGGIRQLDPLAGMPLVFLSCWGNRIESLGPLHGMPLTSLFCGGNDLTDVEALREMPLTVLQISGNRIWDLSPLENSRLTWLSCAANRIESLEPLRNCGLNFLSCHGNRISDVSPLQGMSLGMLTCGSNPLNDIGHLLQSPPQDFAFECESIPLSALKNIGEQWSGRPELSYHANNVSTLVALREGRISDLFQKAHVFGDHRYLYIPRFMTWPDAARFCEKLGGSLLTVFSAEENDFITDMIPYGCWVWLGLVRAKEGFEWITGEPLLYEHFADALQRHKIGHKVFNGTWCNEDIPQIENCFVVKWSENAVLPPDAAR